MEEGKIKKQKSEKKKRMKKKNYEIGRIKRKIKGTAKACKRWGNKKNIDGVLSRLTETL